MFDVINDPLTVSLEYGNKPIVHLDQDFNALIKIMHLLRLNDMSVIN